MTTQKQRFTAYLPQELSDRLAQYKAEHGFKGDSEALNTILHTYFGVSHQSMSLGITPETVSDLPGKLKALEKRIEALELFDKKPFEQVSHPGKSMSLGITPRTASDILSIASDKRADGLQWLTTQQAYAVATQQGCDRSYNGFRTWSKRNPADCERLYGLRSTGYSGKSNIAASFERVKSSL